MLLPAVGRTCKKPLPVAANKKLLPVATGGHEGVSRERGESLSSHSVTPGTLELIPYLKTRCEQGDREEDCSGG